MYSESELLLQLVLFAVRLIPLVFVGAVFANLCVELGVADRIARFINPLLRAAALPKGLSIPLIMVPLEPRVGHAMISSMLERGEIGEREVIASSFLVTPLVIAIFLVPRYYLPVAFPALGVTVATIYILCTLLCSLAKMGIAIVYGQLTAHGGKTPTAIEKLHSSSAEASKRSSRRDVFIVALKEAAVLTKKVAVRTLAVVLFLAVAGYVGLFLWLENGLSSAIGFIGLPAHTITIAATYAVSPLAGIALAGAVLSQTEVSCRGALAGLLLGSALFRLSSEYPRHSFPFYASVYPVKVAFKLVALSIAIDLPVLLALTAAVLIFM
ncbi:MAG: hypothetical protein DRJ98_06815 [Thermoprotei archaeon]|nr:MAG: hypothetical protein DRJ98_06815 [Thermoprotei archaeon]